MIRVWRRLKEKKNFRLASGESWDKYVERGNRLKDFAGHALILRHAIAGTSDGAVGPPLAGPVAAMIQRRDNAGQQRFGFPIVLSPGSASFDAALESARASWAKFA